MASSRSTKKSRRRNFWVGAPVVLGGLILLSLMAFVAQGAQVQTDGDLNDVIEPELAVLLRDATPDERFDILVDLSVSAALSYQSLPESETDRHKAVLHQLQHTAESTQAGLLLAVNQLEEKNLATFERSFWIVNAIQLSANREAIFSLAARDDVDHIKINARIQLIDPQEINIPTSDTDPTWGLERIRAPHVWDGLGIDGSGVTIAIMDTGVDWLHPILRDNYRGRVSDELIIHDGNWFDAVEGTSEPIDPNGHGTHVAGTAVGNSGFGVAPGANWIGVRILNEAGFGSIGDIHAGFQWLLAPDGDPDLAPDLVNNSWSGPAQFMDFVQDVDILRAAGIIPMFAAGNNGPAEGSIGSPANYPGAIAVGAIDDTNLLAWFSSIGPSLLTEEFKPTFTAPGTHVLSALPGSSFGYKNGTSMATPHAVGTYALLMSADPTLSEEQLTRIITTTAKLEPGQSVGHELGWGRLDAYGAVASIVELGTVEVTIQLDGKAQGNLPVVVENELGKRLTFFTNEEGLFDAKLLPGQYAISAAQFGYSPSIRESVLITKGQISAITLNLPRLPAGSISGQIKSSQGSETLSGTLSVMNTPIVIESEPDGNYYIGLPTGDYELIASVTGHSIGRTFISVNEDHNQVYDFLLEPISRTLLVDSGSWYYSSQITYFQSALLSNNVSYDLLTIRNPFSDGPTAEDLSAYELVVWSSPNDSPGTIGVGGAIATYLEEGGDLLISGQDVAFLDGLGVFSEPWWYSQLNGIFSGEAAAPFHINGEPDSIFAGLEMQLNGIDSAQNQFHPDKSIPRYGTLTTPLFRFEDGDPAGLQISNCEPFRIIYFGFGLEGVGYAHMREEIIDRSLDFFSAPDTNAGAKLLPDKFEELAPQGTQQIFELKMVNLSETFTDTFQLSIEGAQWPVQLEASDIEVGPCQSYDTSFSVSIPTGLPIDTTESFDIVLRSTLDPNYSERIPVSLKTPNHILLVDDDRWYDQSSTFQSALEKAGYNYDFWDIGQTSEENGSPPLSLLEAYPIVIWYTGYDWFRPITMAESDIIYSYLEGGGRLFMTSQDYMYYHYDDELTSDFFMVDAYYESLQPTTVFGNPASGFAGSLAGPVSLEYGVYQNFSDGLLPKDGSQASVWHDKGLPGGINAAGEGWRTIFWSLPFETLPTESHPPAMRTIVGWLGDLGESSFVVDKRSHLNDPDSSRTYTLTISNAAGTQANIATITNTLPADLSIDVSSISGGAVYNSDNRQLTWAGVLDPDQEQVISYRTELDSHLPAGYQIDNSVEIHYDRHDLRYQLTAPTWSGAPDVSNSNLILSPTAGAPGTEVRVSASLKNAGSGPAVVSSTLFLLDVLKPLTDTVQISRGSFNLMEDRITWEVELGSGQTETATFMIQIGSVLQTQSIPLLFVINDRVTSALVKWDELTIIPYRYYFPIGAIRPG